MRVALDDAACNSQYQRHGQVCRAFGQNARCIADGNATRAGLLEINILKMNRPSFPGDSNVREDGVYGNNQEP